MSRTFMYHTLKWTNGLSRSRYRRIAAMVFASALLMQMPSTGEKKTDRETEENRSTQRERNLVNEKSINW